jgi:hypothetical protein
VVHFLPWPGNIHIGISSGVSFLRREGDARLRIAHIDKENESPKKGMNLFFLLSVEPQNVIMVNLHVKQPRHRNGMGLSLWFQ